MLDAQVKRMLADPRSAAFADNFAGQWLEIRNLDCVKPDPEKFPEWSPELARRDEDRDAHVLRVRAAREPPDRRISSTRSYTFLNERLAKHYGIDGVKGPDFRRVDLDHRPARRHPEPGQRADGVELSHAHLAR